jgi:hypothetical protein
MADKSDGTLSQLPNGEYNIFVVNLTARNAYRSGGITAVVPGTPETYQAVEIAINNKTNRAFGSFVDQEPAAWREIKSFRNEFVTSDLTPAEKNANELAGRLLSPFQGRPGPSEKDAKALAQIFLAPLQYPAGTSRQSHNKSVKISPVYEINEVDRLKDVVIKEAQSPKKPHVATH